MVLAYQLVLSALASRDIVTILRWSRREFGERAAERYEALIDQALTDISLNPQREGTRRRMDLTGREVRFYPIAASRDRVDGDQVRRPRHLLFYRVEGTTITLARVLHEAMDVSQRLADSEG